MVTIVSGINLWGAAMSNIDIDVKDLQERVENIEKILYPPDGSPDIAAQLEEVIDGIETLEKEIFRLSSNKAEKADLDKAVKILAQLQPVLESLKSKSNVKTMKAGKWSFTLTIRSNIGPTGLNAVELRRCAVS